MSLYNFKEHTQKRKIVSRIMQIPYIKNVGNQNGGQVVEAVGFVSTASERLSLGKGG